MIEMKKSTTDKKSPHKIFSDELIEQLLNQVQSKNAEPLLRKACIKRNYVNFLELNRGMLDSDLSH